MRLIGLCGQSGSGKSLLAKLANQQGIKVIDCDKIYSELVATPTPCLLEIAQSFGDAAVLNNSLNRPYLAQIVFSNKEKLELLNNITHKYVIQQVNQILSSGKDEDIFILDAPALFESGMDLLCDKIIAVIAPYDLCISRIVARDNITRDKAKARISSQYSKEFLIDNCDIIIYNGTSRNDYYADCLSVITAIKEGRL